MADQKIPELLTDVFVELHVPEFDSAKKWYGAIGYEVVWEKPFVDKKSYMVMRSGKSVLGFYGGSEKVYEHEYFGQFPKNTPHGYGVELVVPITGVEKFYNQFEKIHQKSIVTPLQHKHSHKDFRTVDPYGYYLRFVERYNWVDGRDAQGKKITSN